MELNIITPVSRPENIGIISENLLTVCKEIKPIWYCCFDKGVPLPKKPENITFGFWGNARKKSFFGNSSKNQMLEMFESGWVYFLDDDNLLHPDFEKCFLEAVEQYPSYHWFIFDQIRKDGSLYLEATSRPSINHVDTGQCVVRREAIGILRFKENEYAADGILYTKLLAKEIPIAIRKTATYYNALR